MPKRKKDTGTAFKRGFKEYLKVARGKKSLADAADDVTKHLEKKEKRKKK